MLIRHSFLYVAAKLIPGLFGMVTTALLTRLLAPAQYGRYGLALVVMTFGSMIAFDWLGLAYLRVAQPAQQPNRADRLVATSTFVQLFLALAGGTLLLAVVAWAAGLIDPAELPVVAAGLLMTWAYAWFELVSRFHVADLRPGVYLRMNLGRAGLILSVACLAAWLTRDPVWTAIGTAVGTAAGACLGGVGGYRLGPAAFDRTLARAALVFGLPLAASLALSSLAGSGARALVSTLGSIEALGLYTAAFVLVQNTLATVAAGIASAGFSLAVRAVDSGDPAAARAQLHANGSLMLAVLAPAAVGMALTSRSIAALLVGPEYVAAVAALTPWMAAGAFFAGLRAHYLDHAFQLGHRPHGQIWVMAVAAVVTIGFAVALIPSFGPVGAAIAVTAGMIASTIYAVLAGRRAYRLPLPWDAAWRVALACAVMAGCVSAAPAILAVQVLLGAASYAACAVALDVLGARDRLAGVLLLRALRASSA